jgi:hypothetical protein
MVLVIETGHGVDIGWWSGSDVLDDGSVPLASKKA